MEITHKYVLKYTDDYRVAYRFILFTRRNICSYNCHSYKVILTTMIVHPTSLLLLKDIKTRRISEECTVLHASLKQCPLLKLLCNMQAVHVNIYFQLHSGPCAFSFQLMSSSMPEGSQEVQTEKEKKRENVSKRDNYMNCWTLKW